MGKPQSYTLDVTESTFPNLTEGQYIVGGGGPTKAVSDLLNRFGYGNLFQSGCGTERLGARGPYRFTFDGLTVLVAESDGKNGNGNPEEYDFRITVVRSPLKALAERTVVYKTARNPEQALSHALLPLNLGIVLANRRRVRGRDGGKLFEYKLSGVTPDDVMVRVTRLAGHQKRGATRRQGPVDLGECGCYFRNLALGRPAPNFNEYI